MVVVRWPERGKGNEQRRRDQYGWTRRDVNRGQSEQDNKGWTLRQRSVSRRMKNRRADVVTSFLVPRLHPDRSHNNKSCRKHKQ
ncbi:hypothetical protein VZT92_025469 [Zoarces viviparus]|uniref:Uncharacterized protein n=1 Tax=Zoarces viviparus TaxID=48416 RepID=A0AAW1DWV4_ZOAVI